MIFLIALLFLLLGGSAQAQIATPLLAPPTLSGSGGMAVPPGAPPQLIGYSAANTAESVTVTGDLSYQRVGPNQYKATVSSLNGTAVGPLATLVAGTGLTTSATTLSLTVPVAIPLGGTGGTTLPTTTGQLLLSKSTTAFAPVTMTGDATIDATGKVTVHALEGTPVGGTCPAGEFITSINNAGVPVCTPHGIAGVPPGNTAWFVGYDDTNASEAEILSGGNGNCTYARSTSKRVATKDAPAGGTYALNCSYAQNDSPTFTGAITMPDGSTWSATGVNGASGNFGTLTAQIINASVLHITDSKGGITLVNGAVYQQPGFNGTTYPAFWDMAGFQKLQAIGIGQNTGADPLGITANQNGPTLIRVLNNNSGANASTGIMLSNGSGTITLQMNGTGHSPGPNAAQLSSDRGIYYNTGAGLPHTFQINGNQVGYFASNGLHLPFPLEVASGGSGTALTPAQNQILIAQSATAYAPKTLAGDLSISSGGLVTVNGMSGAQIKHYTPQLIFAGAPCTPAGYDASGAYTVSGHQVDVQWRVGFTGWGSCNSTATYLGISLPYQPDSTVDNYGYYPIYFTNTQNVSDYVAFASLNGNQTQLELVYFDTKSGQQHYFTASQVNTQFGVTIGGQATYMF